tara:strand:+ start:345 stop:1469 length:1125 start_codon:yes stop_codon:yes gene_type:complete
MQGTIDMIHLDPPFGSEANYDRRLTVETEPGPISFQLRAYGDRDGDDLAGYLDILQAVLRRSHQLLAPHGSLYLHLDPRRGPYARLLLDEIFGSGSFINQIVWAYGLGGSSRKRFGRKHDVIYLFAKDPSKMYFNAPKEKATSSMLAGQPKLATDIWETQDADTNAALLRAWPDSLVRRTMSNRDPERTGYPTQKPLSLCERMVSSSCPPGGTVLDPMAGSGTALVAAARLGRHVIGGDMGGPALDVCRARLLQNTATLSLNSLDGHRQPLPWRGAPAFYWGKGRCILQQTPVPAEVLNRLRIQGARSPDDMRHLWSGWGLLDDEGQALHWIDAGPGRKRSPCEFKITVKTALRVTQWLGIDVLGNLWQSPLDS